MVHISGYGRVRGRRYVTDAGDWLVLGTDGARLCVLWRSGVGDIRRLDLAMLSTSAATMLAATIGRHLPAEYVLADG